MAEHGNGSVKGIQIPSFTNIMITKTSSRYLTANQSGKRMSLLHMFFMLKTITIGKEKLYLIDLSIGPVRENSSKRVKRKVYSVKISKDVKFETWFVETNEYSAPHSRRILQTFVWGTKFVPTHPRPPRLTKQKSVKFSDFVKQYIFARFQGITVSQF